MKKTKSRLIVGLALSAVFVVSASLIYQNGALLKGTFPVTAPVLCAPSKLLPTVYVKAGAAAGGTGTKASPYNAISDAQTALETDKTLKRVCFSGILTGNLDLDGALSKNITLEPYVRHAKLESTGITLHQETGNLKNLTIKNLDIDGSMQLAPQTSLTMSNVDVGGGGHANALWLSSTDTVTISDSSFDDSDIGIDTDQTSANAVGSLTLSKVTFTNMVDKAISAYYLDTLSVSESNLTYTDEGIYAEAVKSIAIDKSIFTGGGFGTGLEMKDDPAIATVLDFENNFVSANYAVFERTFARGIPSTIAATIYHNSFYNNYNSLGFVATTTAENNVVFAGTNSGRVFGSTTYAAALTSDYNLFYGELAFEAKGLADWQSATGLDSNSVYGDPLFVSTSDLHLSSASSPAVDVGTNLGITDDIDGDARTAGSIDMGADEF